VWFSDYLVEYHKELFDLIDTHLSNKTAYIDNEGEIHGPGFYVAKQKDNRYAVIVVDYFRDQEGIDIHTAIIGYLPERFVPIEAKRKASDGRWNLEIAIVFDWMVGPIQSILFALHTYQETCYQEICDIASKPIFDSN
jgi:hypothetical protein